MMNLVIDQIDHQLHIEQAFMKVRKIPLKIPIVSTPITYRNPLELEYIEEENADINQENE